MYLRNMRILLLLLLPISILGQNQAVAEKNCEAWIRQKMEDDASTYRSLVFKDLEEVKTLSEDGIKEIKGLKREKYLLLESTLNEESAIDNYRGMMENLNTKIKEARKNHSTKTGYTLVHKFMARDDEGFQVHYRVNYELDMDLKVKQSSISRKVDRASSDY